MNRVMHTLYVTDTSVSPSVPLFELTVCFAEEGYVTTLWSCRESMTPVISGFFQTEDAAFRDMYENHVLIMREVMKPYKILVKEVKS